MVKTACLHWSIPLISYRKAWEIQQRQVSRIAAGDDLPTLLFLEHEPVVTLGRAGNENHFLVPEEVLQERGVDCIRIDRGGDITYHGPGQLVVYPLFPLTRMERDVHAYLRRIETVGLRVLTGFGIDGCRVPPYTGVWVGDRKIMAIGIGVKKWVTFHGLAFNFANDLEGFQWIIPCGIKGKGVTSLHLLLNRPVTRAEIETRFREEFQEVFNLELNQPSNPFLGGSSE